MAEQRKKTHSILLSTGSKNITVELFDAALWPEKTSTDGLFRARIDGKWYTAAGKYTFIPYSAVGDLLALLLQGAGPYEEEAPPPALKKGQRVAVSYGECSASVPVRSEMGWTVTPPYRGIDGQWYVFVQVYGGMMPVPVYDIDPR